MREHPSLSPCGSFCWSLAGTPNLVLVVQLSSPCTGGVARADSAALLIGSVSELLLQSRRGAENTAFIPVRPIDYVLTPAPSGTKW